MPFNQSSRGGYKKSRGGSRGSFGGKPRGRSTRGGFKKSFGGRGSGPSRGGFKKSYPSKGSRFGGKQRGFNKTRGGGFRKSFSSKPKVQTGKTASFYAVFTQGQHSIFPDWETAKAQIKSNSHFKKFSTQAAAKEWLSEKSKEFSVATVFRFNEVVPDALTAFLVLQGPPSSSSWYLSLPKFQQIFSVLKSKNAKIPENATQYFSSGKIPSLSLTPSEGKTISYYGCSCSNNKSSISLSGDVNFSMVTDISSSSRNLLLSLIFALQSVSPATPLTLKCCSEYGVKAVGSWTTRWRRKEWKNSDGSLVKNVDLIPLVETLISSRIATTHIAWDPEDNSAKQETYKSTSSQTEKPFDADSDFITVQL